MGFIFAAMRRRAWLLGALVATPAWCSTPGQFYGTSESGVEFMFSLDGAQESAAVWRPQIYTLINGQISDDTHLPSNCELTSNNDGQFVQMRCSKVSGTQLSRGTQPSTGTPPSHGTQLSTGTPLDGVSYQAAATPVPPAQPVLQCIQGCSNAVPATLTYYGSEE